MAGRLTDVGEEYLCGKIGVSYRVRLFKSPTTDPDVDTVVDCAVGGDLEECDFDGYSYADINMNVISEVTSGNWAATASSLATFTHNGDGSGDTNNTVYGFALCPTDGDTTRVVYYEYFASPVTMNYLSSPIVVLPRLRLFGEEECP